MPELHGPSIPAEKSNPLVEGYNARLGLGLFLLYLLFYGAFVVINAVWPQWMDVVVWSGLNLAVVYGLGLIVGAFVLALVYALLCKTPAKESV
ncbi:MAG TPA: DUF485 domain-containing protein [Gemmatales bacterium]|nr:DUF485 domain-containing protein [Gemmatales bacterium]